MHTRSDWTAQGVPYKACLALIVSLVTNGDHYSKNKHQTVFTLFNNKDIRKVPLSSQILLSWTLTQWDFLCASPASLPILHHHPQHWWMAVSPIQLCRARTTRLDGECLCTVIVRSLRRCWIGFKSGLWLGQNIHSGPFGICTVCSGSVLLEDETEGPERYGAGYHRGCLRTCSSLNK